MTKRMGHIDIARGIGILLVVLGHSDIGYYSPFAYQVIYSFHMPLFFFLSGYFINTSIGFWSYTIKRFNSLLKPYLFTIFIIYFTSVSFENMSFKIAFGRIIKSIYASGYYIDWAPLWFLPHLFVVSLYAFFFYKLSGKTNSRFFKWGILVATLWFASFFLQKFYPFPLTVFGKEYEIFGLPFSLDLVFLSGFFFILGGEIRQVTTEQTFENLFLLFGTGLGVILLNLFFSQRIDFYSRIYDSFLINTIEAFIGILFILALSRQIELRMPKLASLLSYFGRISIMILIFHVPIQDFWGQKILGLTDNLSISIWGGFIMGVTGSILIYELFIKANPVASWWFGRQEELPEQKAALSKN